MHIELVSRADRFYRNDATFKVGEPLVLPLFECLSIVLRDDKPEASKQIPDDECEVEVTVRTGQWDVLDYASCTCSASSCQPVIVRTEKPVMRGTDITSYSEAAYCTIEAEALSAELDRFIEANADNLLADEL